MQLSSLHQCGVLMHRESDSKMSLTENFDSRFDPRSIRSPGTELKLPAGDPGLFEFDIFVPD